MKGFLYNDEMKILILNLSFFITFFCFSKEIILKIEGSGRGKEYEIMQLDNNSKVVLYKTEGNFKTELDLYGSTDCLGVFKKINNAADLDLTCEFVDQNKNKMWANLIRKTEDIDAGVGKMLIIGGTGSWRYLKDTTCKYAVTLNNSIWFTSTLCNVDEDIFEKFKNNL